MNPEAKQINGLTGLDPLVNGGKYNHFPSYAGMISQREKRIVFHQPKLVRVQVL